MDLSGVIILIGIAICIAIPIINKVVKKIEDRKRAVEDGYKITLEKHLADVNNPKQVVMASGKKSLNCKKVKNYIVAAWKSYTT